MKKDLSEEQIDFMNEYYDCNINDIHEYFRHEECNDDIDFNIGEFERNLSEFERYTIMDDLGISNSDIELGYHKELLSNYINDGYIERIAKDNDIVWDKSYVKDRDPKLLKNQLKIYSFNDGEWNQRIAQCPICGEMRYVTGIDFKRDIYVCPGCKIEFKSEITNNSRGEELIDSLLKKYNLEFKREVSEIGSYRYDFIVYHGNSKYYIEIHGMQHYKPVEYFGGASSFLKTVKSDLVKKEHANKNGVYVELDYREHDTDLLKQRFMDEFLNKYILNGGMK